jgi:hypothetical protein
MSSATHDTVGANLDTDVQDAILEIRDIDRDSWGSFAYFTAEVVTGPNRNTASWCGANADGPQTFRRIAE